MELRHDFDLNLLLNQLNMARGSFYYHQKQSKLPDKYKVVKELIKSIFHKHKGRQMVQHILYAWLLYSHAVRFRLQISRPLTDAKLQYCHGLF